MMYPILKTKKKWSKHLEYEKNQLKRSDMSAVKSPPKLWVYALLYLFTYFICE